VWYDGRMNATQHPNRITIYLAEAENAKPELEAIAAEAGIPSISGLLRRIRDAARVDRVTTVAALRDLPAKKT